MGRGSCTPPPLQDRVALMANRDEPGQLAGGEGLGAESDQHVKLVLQLVPERLVLQLPPPCLLSAPPRAPLPRSPSAASPSAAGADRTGGATASTPAPGSRGAPGCRSCSFGSFKAASRVPRRGVFWPRGALYCAYTLPLSLQWPSRSPWG